MQRKIIVECNLPQDYCLSNIFVTEGLEYLVHGNFYAITSDKKLIKKTLQESGFGFDDTDHEVTEEFNISQQFNTHMGRWESVFHVVVVKGVVHNIYEVSTVLQEKDD
jgi:hypothetical protein